MSPASPNPISAALDDLARREEAYQVSDGPLPAPPPERGPKRRGLVKEHRLIGARAPTVSIEDARQQIWHAMQEYLAMPHPTHLLLVKAPPGVGKTTLAAKLAEQHASEGHRVLYAGPRHDFFADLLSAATQPRWWYEWLPRQQADETGMQLETCRYAPQITRWLNRGYDAMDFCSNPKICGWEYVNEHCPYHAQKLVKKPIIFGQHAHITGGHPLMEQISLVIGDENPLSAFLHDWIIPASAIVPQEMDPAEPLTEILHELYKLASRGVKAEGPDLLRLLGGAAEVREACELFTIPLDAVALAPNLRSAHDVDEAPYFHLPQLVHLLRQEATAAEMGADYPARVAIANSKLHLLLRRPANTRLPSHVIWLDATAEPHVYETLFGRPVEVIAPQVELKGRVFQVWDRANGKSTLINTKDGAPTVRADQLEHQVRQIITRYGYQQPAIITFQALHRLFEHLPQSHFYAARGTNRFERCDAIIIAGTPLPSLAELTKQARMLFQERMTAFNTAWFDQYVPYPWMDAAGDGASYPVGGFWADTDLQALLWQYREAELIQAAHRVRPVLREVDIWLLTNVPLADLPLTQLLTIRELFGAPEGVDPYRWPQVLSLAELFYADGRALTPTDLAEWLDLAPATATKYWTKLRDAQPDRWHETKALAPNQRTGPPRKTLVPRSLKA